MFKISQAVILAAGQGERMQPLTLTKPKPLLKVVNKTVLEHNLDGLNNLVKEVILVIGYRGEMIKKFIGSNYKNLKIRYVFQKKQLGTGDAARQALPFLKDKFILLNGDDIYNLKDIKNCLKKHPSILLARVNRLSFFGVANCQRNFVKNLVEKPKKPQGFLANTGLYFLDKSIFDFKIKKSPRGEYEFTDYLKKLIKQRKLYFKVAKEWTPISYPWDLLEANEFLLGKIKEFSKGKIEKNCHILGKVIIEKGTLIKSGSYIEGPVYIGKNCLIGPNCYIRGLTNIGDNCRIGQGAEIKNSVIGDNCRIAHFNYLGNSVIGDNCNLGAGVILANLRFDDQTIKFKIKGKMIDTEKNKFGSVLGDNVKVGVNASLMPGILVGSNSVIGPNSLVRKNVEEKTIFYSPFQEVIKKRKIN